MSDDGPYLVWAVIAAVFVASSLIGMRMPVGKVVKMALAWVAIFAVGFLLFSFRSEFSSVGQRLRAEATGTPIETGGVVRIPVGEDGHYWAWAKLNGKDVRFMVDSGASVTTVSRPTAIAAGMPIGAERTMVSTANGRAWMVKGRADSLAVGSIRRTQFPVDINEGDDTYLLGMNFLTSLSGWGVGGSYLVLR
ncbi:MAG TPA: TIGR02281 family clan AA aspartic protease, partial [Sphingomicrobium sp.]